MTSFREIDELGKDLAKARALATRLLKLYGPEWSEWELDFLEGKVDYRGPEPLTTRQCEKLLELRDDMELHTSVDGFNIASLIGDCWIGRFDLNDSDAAFIERIKASGSSALRRRQLYHLLHCARELGHIERYVSVD